MIIEFIDMLKSPMKLSKAVHISKAGKATSHSSKHNNDAHQTSKRKNKTKETASDTVNK